MMKGRELRVNRGLQPYRLCARLYLEAYHTSGIRNEGPPNVEYLQVIDYHVLTECSRLLHRVIMSKQ
jgi:hypothetical protein